MIQPKLFSETGEYMASRDRDKSILTVVHLMTSELELLPDEVKLHMILASQLYYT